MPTYTPPRTRYRTLIHEQSFDESCRRLLGLQVADDLLRDLFLHLAATPSLHRFPLVEDNGSVQRATAGIFAVDFVAEGSQVLLVRLGLRIQERCSQARLSLAEVE